MFELLLKCWEILFIRCSPVRLFCKKKICTVMGVFVAANFHINIVSHSPPTGSHIVSGILVLVDLVGRLDGKIFGLRSWHTDRAWQNSASYRRFDTRDNINLML